MYQPASYSNEHRTPEHKITFDSGAGLIFGEVFQMTVRTTLNVNYTTQ